jgi:hypothetical protein
VVVIPPEELNVVTPTVSKVPLIFARFKTSNDALRSIFEENVDNPATENPFPKLTCFATPNPPEIASAPVVGEDEFVVFENVTIPVTVKLDASIASDIKNFSVDRSHTRIIPSSVFLLESTSDKFTNRVGGADALDKTRITF